MAKKYEFNFRTGKVTIDQSICPKCDTYDCVKACRLYGSGILRLDDGIPVLNVTLEDAQRRDNECLSCEQVCPHGAVSIELAVTGLDDWEKKAGTGPAR
jgi:ferredoxin